MKSIDVHQFKQKWLLLVLVCAGLITLISARLIDLQVVSAEMWSQAAQANRTYKQWLPAHRGVLLDRYGHPLVQNVTLYSIQTSSTSAQLTRIPHNQALVLMASDAASVHQSLGREYQQPKALSHVLGYVGPASKEDLLEHEYLRPTDLVGKSGLEKLYQQQLHGTAGFIEYEVDALGNRLRPLREDPGTPGTVLQTTLDPFLSEVALSALGTQQGAVVIMDADTGEVLASVSNPTYDASLLSQTAETASAKEERSVKVSSYFSDPRKVFFNRAVSGEYPPGSVFKIMTALAGLEYGALDENTLVDDTGILKVGEYEYANWYYTQYGRTEGAISLRRALARSNDIYFYKAAEWIGPTKLMELSARFGLGAAPGSQMPGESVGLLPTPEWKEKAVGERWYLGNTYHVGIGQGDIMVTPLQIASMTQAVANKANRCQPSVLKLDRLSCQQTGVDEKNIAIVVDGLVQACSPGGTAFPFFEHNRKKTADTGATAESLEQGAVACKTGTAEFGGADGRGYRKTHGWFTAFFRVPDAVFTENSSLSSAEGTTTATVSASLSAQTQELATLREKWVATQPKEQRTFPRMLVITVLVESDDTQPYKEGSREAAPVAKTVFDWIYGD